MRRLAFTVALLTVLAAASLEVRGDSAPAAPTFDEVLGLLRQHLSGFSPEQLDRAAVEGLIGALHPRVMLVTNAAAPVLPAQLDQARVFEDNVGYLRVATVGAGLKALLVEAHRELTRTGHIVGMVFDLRYAGGRHRPRARAPAPCQHRRRDGADDDHRGAGALAADRNSERSRRRIRPYRRGDGDHRRAELAP